MSNYTMPVRETILGYNTNVIGFYSFVGVDWFDSLVVRVDWLLKFGLYTYDESED